MARMFLLARSSQAGSLPRESEIERANRLWIRAEATSAAPAGCSHEKRLPAPQSFPWRRRLPHLVPDVAAADANVASAATSNLWPSEQQSGAQTIYISTLLQRLEGRFIGSRGGGLFLYKPTTLIIGIALPRRRATSSMLVVSTLFELPQ